MDPILPQLSEHHDRVRSLLVSLVGDSHRSEDALQDAWVRLLERAPASALDQPRGWLVVAARRLAWNAARGERRRRVHERAAAAADPLPSSAEIAERAEICTRVIEALDSLGEPHTSVLRDHYVGGLSAADLAQRDGLPIETVRTRIKRGRAALRQRLEAKGLGGETHWSLAAAPLVIGSHAVKTTTIAGATTAAGAITMKQLFLPTIAAALLLAGVYFASTLSKEPSPLLVPTSASNAELAGVETTQDAPNLASTSPAAPAERREATQTQAAPSDHCTLTGRVVDADSRPLAGVSVHVAGAAEWPGATDQVPRQHLGPLVDGFATVTGEDGSFQLRCGTPAPLCTLVVRGSRHTTRYSRSLDPSTVKLAPREAVDLGTVTLATASAILGRVVDRNGAPIEGATLGIDSKEFGSIGTSARSAADGTYVLGHNPPGTFDVEAQMSGYLNVTIEGVEARIRQDTRGIDFVLHEAPKITGRVLDDAGKPIAGQRLWAWPTVSGSPVSAETASDGSFEMAIAQLVDYELEVRRRGYRLRNGEGRRGRQSVALGTTEVEVVLERRTPRTLRVLSDASGEPLEHFAFRVIERNGSEASPRSRTSRRAGKIEQHDAGESEFYAEPGVDTLYITAPGFRPFDGDVQFESSPDEAGQHVQTVRLESAPSVTGRVLQSGEPVAGVAVELEAGKVTPVTRLDGKGVYDVFRRERDQARTATTSEDGSFHMDVFPGKTMRVTATLGADLVAVTEPFHATDAPLPDLELAAPGVIEGRVLAPPGMDAEGLKVMVDEWFDSESAMTGSDGAFLIPSVPPGAHTLILRGRDPDIESTNARALLVEPSQTTEAILDASNYGRTKIAFVITVNGEPIEDLGVDVQTQDVFTRGGSRSLGAFGKCDATGYVEGYVRALPDLMVGVYSSQLGEVYHPDVTLTPQLGTFEEVQVNFQTASVTLRLPETATVPTNGYVGLKTQVQDGARMTHRRAFNLEGGDAGVGGTRASCTIDGRDLRFENLIAGKLQLQLDIQDSDHFGTYDEVEQRFVPGVNDRSFVQSIELRPGDNGVVELQQ